MYVIRQMHTIDIQIMIYRYEQHFNLKANMFDFFFFFQAEDGIRDYKVTGVQTCALPILL